VPEQSESTFTTTEAPDFSYSGGADSIDNFTSVTSAPVTPFKPRSIWRQVGWGFYVALGFCVLWILLAIFANLLPLKNPNTPDYNDFQGGFSGGHLLGTDPSGRDILARVIFGSRVSLVVGFLSIGMGLVLGGILGIISGYFRGILDEVLLVITNTFLAFPYLVLGLVIVSFLGHTLFDISLIIAVVAWPLLFRVVRAATIEYSQREYVIAAQALGSTSKRILLTLVLPDVIPAAITYGLVGIALAIIAEGALSFLGQSVPSPTATWGNMIAYGSQQLGNDNIYLQLLVAPSLAMFSFILPINFIGDRLRSVLDVRQGVI
jgi:peptide/nickel transport system permease protein